MPYALVGTIGAVSQGAAGAAVTPAWGTSETRAANNTLICWVAGTGAATLPTTPSGWTILQQTAGTSCSATIYGKFAAGSDAAPTIALAASVVWTVQLAEFSGPGSLSTIGALADHNKGLAGTTSPLTNTLATGDRYTNNLMLYTSCAFYSAAATKTLTNTLNNGATAVDTNNNAVSTVNHYSFGYGFNTTGGTASADSDSFAFTTTSITGAVVVLVSCRTIIPERSMMGVGG